MRGSDVDKSEVQLVQRAADGERDAQRELFERYREVAYRVALRVLGRDEDALDAVQDAFIKAFEALGGFQRDASFKTWLLRIVTNRALDLLRARKVRLSISLDGGDEDDPKRELAGRETAARVGDELEAGELGERLRAAVESLPAEQRAVFALYATGEMKYGEIAEALGIPPGTVMSRLYHARRKLHRMLGEEFRVASSE